MTKVEKTELKMKSIANNIRLLRESKNLTQEYLAMKLGLSQNAFSKIELGYTKITVERLYKIADLLETSAITLLEADEENRSHLFLKREATA